MLFMYVVKFFERWLGWRSTIASPLMKQSSSLCPSKPPFMQASVLIDTFEPLHCNAGGGIPEIPHGRPPTPAGRPPMEG